MEAGGRLMTPWGKGARAGAVPSKVKASVRVPTTLAIVATASSAPPLSEATSTLHSREEEEVQLAVPQRCPPRARDAVKSWVRKESPATVTAAPSVRPALRGAR